MHTVLIVAGTSIFLTLLLAIARKGAGGLLRFIKPGKLRDSLVMPHTERKDWLLAWLPLALFGLFVLVVLHFAH